MRTFKSFIAEGREAGLTVLAPVVVPNDEPDLAHPFAEAYWDTARQAALAGGGLALDTPPAFYLHGFPAPAQVMAYKRFVADALRWGRANRLRRIVILSPYYDRMTFAENARALYRSLDGEGLLPTDWVVESYDDGSGPSPGHPDGSASFGVPIGSDTQPGTVSGVALWFAQHARTDLVGNGPLGRP